MRISEGNPDPDTELVEVPGSTKMHLHKRRALRQAQCPALAIKLGTALLIQMTPSLLLKAYTCGLFPMAESQETSEILWFSPEQRGIIPLDHIHIPRRFARSFRKHPFRVSLNTAFEQIIDGCSGAGCDRETTWINQPLKDIYIHLHKMGFCHSIEIWQEDMLVGGLYGVAIGAAFFGESMFSRASNASKIALVYLIARLKSGRYTLLDTQFNTDHLKQFGAIDIPKQAYLKLLEKACAKKGDFFALTQTLAPDRVLECIMRDMHNF